MAIKTRSRRADGLFVWRIFAVYAADEYQAGMTPVSIA
jgi:hypothetical protein